MTSNASASWLRWFLYLPADRQAPLSTLDARHPAHAEHAARRGRQAFDVGAHRDAPGRGAWLRPCAPTGTASKRQASPASCAGEAFVLSQVNPELVV